MSSRKPKRLTDYKDDYNMIIAFHVKAISSLIRGEMFSEAK